MTALFVSHRSVDNAEAQALKDWLGQQGHQQLFLDFDPIDGIPAGVDWEQRLYQELRRCQALVIVLTPAWLASVWCRNELAIAREKGKAVFVVRVKPGGDGPVLPSIQEVDITAGREAALAKLARGLKEHGLNPADSFDWQPGRPIYPGLAAFDVDDAAVFFGRSEESWDVVERMRRMRLQAVGAPKLLLVTGASGSGKSSLMRAGVLPRLGKEPGCWIVARPFRRGADDLGGLPGVLAQAFPGGRLPDGLAGPDTPERLLAIASALRQALGRPAATLVLALDQAEEVLTAGHAEDSARLLDLLRGALAQSGTELLVLATIRSDRAGAWQQHASVKATADHDELAFEMAPLGPMPLERIGEIVRGPARHEGLTIDDDLVQAIVTDTDTPDALPLLAYTLRFMHDRFAGDGRLTLAEYRSFGGLEGSIRTQADAAIAMERMDEEDRRALRDAFVPGLVRAAGEAGFVRSRARLDSLPARAAPYLRRLVDGARLLQTDRDAQGHETVEVTHEALLRVWPTLQGWLREDGVKLRRLEALQRAATDWVASERGADYLVHRAYRLGDVEALAAEPHFQAQLTALDRDYMAACRAAQTRSDAEEADARDRALRAAQTEVRRRRNQARAGAAVAVVLLVAAGAAVWQYGVARSALRLGEETSMALREQTVIARRELDRANTALAAGIWNDLDFEGQGTGSLSPGEAKALWALATGDERLGRAFAGQLWSNPGRQRRFEKRPELVSRALGLAWPSPEQALEGLRPIMTWMQAAGTEGEDTSPLVAELVARNLPATDVADTLRALAALMRQQANSGRMEVGCEMAGPLAERLPVAQAPEFVDLLLQTLEAAATPDQRSCVAETLATLAGRVARDDADRVVPEVFRALLVREGQPETLYALIRVAKALRAQPTAAQVDAVADALARSAAQQGGSLRAAARAMAAFPAAFTPSQTEAVLQPILKAVERVQIPSREPPARRLRDIRAVANALEALSPKLQPEQARSALLSVVAVVAGLRDADQAMVFAPALTALAGQLPAEQAATAFQPVLDAVGGMDAAAVRTAMAPAVLALAERLPTASAADALRAVVQLLQRKPEHRDLGTEAEATLLLVQRIPPDEAATVVPILLDGIGKAKTPGEIATLARAVEALDVRLNPDEVQAAFERTLQGFGGGLSETLDAVVPALRALAGQLSPDQAAQALEKVLDIADEASGTESTGNVAAAVRALSTRLPALRAHAVVAPALAELASNAKFEPLRALIDALPPLLTDSARQGALGPALAAMPEVERDPFRVLPVALTIEALKVPLTPEQGRAALMSLVKAAAQPTGMGPFTIGEIERLVRALARPVPVADRSPAMAAITQAWTEEAARSEPVVRRVQLLAGISRALGVPLSPEQERTAQDVVFKGLLEVGGAEAFQGLLEAIPGDVPDARLAPLLDAAMGRLAWSLDEEAARQWATGLATLLRRADTPVRVARIVEALKYPSTAGAPTTVLLDALHAANARAPGQKAGLAANLVWVRAAYPGIDPAKPPACPAPRDPAIACPARSE